jgi:hypothetical protein
MMEPQTIYEENKKAARQVFLMSMDQIDHYWPDIVRVLGEVPGYYDFFTTEWTYGRAREGALQIWGFTDGSIQGIAVTQILVFPAQKAFEILGAGGPGMLDFIDEMETVFQRIARDAKCNSIIARARPGLVRKLAREKGALVGAVWIYRPVTQLTEN